MMNRFINNYGFSFIAQRCAGVVIDCVFKVVINLSVHTRIQFYSLELFKFFYHLLFQCRRFVRTYTSLLLNCMIDDHFNSIDLGFI